MYGKSYDPDQFSREFLMEKGIWDLNIHNIMTLYHIIVTNYKEIDIHLFDVNYVLGCATTLFTYLYLLAPF